MFIFVVRKVIINEILHHLSQNTWRQEENVRNATRRSVSYAVNPFEACNDCYNHTIQKCFGKWKILPATTTTTTTAALF